MLMRTPNYKTGLGAEVRLILQRGRQVWRLVPPQHKWALGAAAVVIFGVSVCNVAMPLLLGRLVDGVQTGVQQGLDHSALYAIALGVLGLLSLTYVVREVLNVLRRYLVENTCTRINREMSVRLVSHLLKIDLAALSQEKVGALNGRIFRSVDGYVRFLRIGFLDFFPALITGALALATALVKQPWLGAAMFGVVPIAVYLTVRQLMSQKGVRLKLMRSVRGNRRRPRRTARAASSTSAPPTPITRKRGAWRAPPSDAGPRRSAITSRWPCSAAPRPSTRASSTFWCSARRSSWRSMDE